MLEDYESADVPVGCREGSLTIDSPGVVAGCASPGRDQETDAQSASAATASEFCLLRRVAPVRARSLRSIQVCTGISLRIVWVLPGMIILAAGGADPGRKPTSGWNRTGGGVAVYVGSRPFLPGDVLGIPTGSIALGS